MTSMKSNNIYDFVSHLQRASRTIYVRTLDVDDDEGIEITTWAVRFNKKDAEPKFKKAFIQSETRTRMNSDFYFAPQCGWRVIWERKYSAYFGEVHPEDTLYEGDYKVPHPWCEYLFDIDNVHELIPETKYFKELPLESLIEFIQKWRKNKEIEFIYKNDKTQHLWSDTRIFKLSKEKQIKVLPLLKQGYSLNDALGILKYGSEQAMIFKRKCQETKKVLKKYKFSKELIEDITRYLIKQSADIWTYEDYLNDCKYFKRRLTARGCLFPRDFKSAHDNLARMVREEERLKWERQEAKREAHEQMILGKFEKKSLELANLLKDFLGISKENLTIFLPMTKKDLIDIGEKLEICVGGAGYDLKVINGTSIIIAVYMDDQPLECCELRHKRGGGLRIEQLRGANNQDSERHQECKELVNTFIHAYSSTQTMARA